jgi:diguanylate cyclase (GGDEF)-like protein
MPRDTALAEQFHRRFFLQVAVPLLTVLALSLVGAVYAIQWATHRSDEASVAQQRRMMEVAIDSTVASTAAQQRSVALWRPLAVQLQRPVLDAAFLDENIGGWLHAMFGHDRTYIVDAAGVPVYANIDGQRPSPEQLATAASDVKPLLDSLKRAAAVMPRHSAPSATGGGTADQIADLMLIQSRPAVVALSRVPPLDEGQQRDRRGALSGAQPAPGGGPSPSAAPPERSASRHANFSILNVVFLDDAYLADLSERTLLRDLRFVGNGDTAAPRDDEARFALPARDGRALGELVWRAELPGTEMRAAIAPAALAVLAIVMGIFGVMTRQLWRSSCNLLQTLRELRASEAQAQHLAFHDVLTGLPNRAMFDERLGLAMAHAMRTRTRMAVLIMDLDRFKQVNDTMGHHAGDVLIREIAARISADMREGDTVARVGGDEFMIILNDVGGERDTEAYCERLLNAVRRPFNLLGSQIVSSATIGFALAPDDATDRGELVRRADIALYAAKSAGRDTWRHFDQAMDDTVKLRNAVANDLRAALAQGRDLRVVYQPQVDGTGRRVVGLEALLRWKHPTRGAIRPDEFIPIAEETGLIGPLGEWVFREACRTARRWPALFMAVNVSPIQFRNPTLAERLIGIAREEQCDPSGMEIEITEGLLLEDDEGVRAALAALRRAGFKIALDDFGTGYSSLSYLQRFPVDKIKIDRSFTQSLNASADAPVIIESVIGLGRAMGLTVTAEGVETPEQMNALVAAGCTELQGYLFSHPHPEGQLGEAITKLERQPATLEEAIEHSR